MPTRVLLTAIALGAFTAGALYPGLIFFVIGLGAVVLLATSVLSPRRPLMRALLQYQNHPVQVRLWGAPPPDTSGVLTLTAVNAIGAGLHLFFSGKSGTSLHLKVAQAQDPAIGETSVVIRAARYVQWNGKKIPCLGSAPAVSVASCPPLPEGSR